MSRLIFEIEICVNLVTLSPLIFPHYNLNTWCRLIVLQKSSSLRKILPTDTCPTMRSSSHLTNSHLRCQETQPIFARVDGCVALPSCQLSLINCFIFQHYSLRICYGIGIDLPSATNHSFLCNQNIPLSLFPLFHQIVVISSWLWGSLQSFCHLLMI